MPRYRVAFHGRDRVNYWGPDGFSVSRKMAHVFEDYEEAIFQCICLRRDFEMRTDERREFFVEEER